MGGGFVLFLGFQGDLYSCLLHLLVSNRWPIFHLPALQLLLNSNISKYVSIKVLYHPFFMLVSPSSKWPSAILGKRHSTAPILMLLLAQRLSWIYKLYFWLYKFILTFSSHFWHQQVGILIYKIYNFNKI